MQKKKTVQLSDSDGDGFIKFRWDNHYEGVSILLVDLFGNEVSATFHKSQLIPTLKKALDRLENEI